MKKTITLVAGILVSLIVIATENQNVIIIINNILN